jgi:hypothetical protein
MMNRLLIVEPLGVEPLGVEVNKSGRLYALSPIKWSYLIRAVAIEPPFSGTIFITVRIRDHNNNSIKMHDPQYCPYSNKA